MATQTSSFLSLSDRVREIAKELGIEHENPVQSSAIRTFFSSKKEQNMLIIAPTGSGKTEAALLPIFHEIISDRKKGGIRALYITPLRALNRDMMRRMRLWGERLQITVGVRHGDTTQKERRAQSLKPPEILITTPETLQVLLIGSRLRHGLENVEWVVVDEIHELAGDRRGAQLSVGLERLCQLKREEDPIKRIGLSATVSNKEEVSKFLSGERRGVSIVDASSLSKVARYRTELPESDSEQDLKKAGELYISPKLLTRLERICDLVKTHESTLLFVNSRTQAEYLATKLYAMGTQVGVHHGSLPREERERVERDFKEKKIPAMVCTSTLELGIDIGSVDLVVQYMSPRQVSAMVQRVGRSGHSLSKSSEGITITVTPEDALESIAISKLANEKIVEDTIIQASPLDVLCHQIAGLLIEYGGASEKNLTEIIKRSFCFNSLTTQEFSSVVQYMETLGYIRREGERIIPRAKCRQYYLENLSMIPDERRYVVVDASTNEKVGILGEEFMILHAEVGVNFVIKGKAWKIESIQRESVYVTPVKDPSAAVPGWDGELIPIPQSTAQAVARERRRVAESNIEEERRAIATSEWNADKNARLMILQELRKQEESKIGIPTDMNILVEGWKRFVIIHTNAGDRINLTLGELFEEILLRRGLIRHFWTDGYRILIELVSDEYNLDEIVSLLFHYDDSKRGFMLAVLRKHFPFGYYMKFVAERFGALKRGMMLSGETLKELVVRFRFTPVYEETLREALMSKVDVEGALAILKCCTLGEISLKSAIAQEPSPLAMYILSRYAEMEEYQADARGSYESMKSAISKEVLSLLCFRCANLLEYVRVESIHERPECTNCGSELLAPIFFAAAFARESLLKKIGGKPLSNEEESIIARSRRGADIVLSYGKQGIIALSVHGIGPQTASRVLSKMRQNEEDFYADLLDAKLNFIRTKEFWD